MNQLRLRWASGVLAASLCVLLAACGKRTEADVMGAAEAFIAKGELSAAVIELKTALQDWPQSAQARFLLGRTLLEMGDVPGAIVELRKAGELQLPQDTLAPTLARALLAQGQFAEVVAAYAGMNLSEPRAQGQLRATVATAYAAQNKPAQALSELEKAMASAPDDPQVLLAQARLRAAEGRFDDAFAAIDHVLKLEPNSEVAWSTRGEMLLEGKRDAVGAAQAYRQLIALKKGSVQGHTGLVLALMGQDDLAGAAAAHAEMAKVLPQHPSTLFLQAQLAFLKRDVPRAREIIQQVLKVAPDDPRVLQLAGMIATEQRAWVQAEGYLKKATLRSSNPRFPSTLLAQNYVSSGQPAKALELLQPYLAQSDRDGVIQVLLAESYLQLGDLPRATEHFQRAAELRPDDTRVRVALAMARLNKGDRAGAFAELQQVAAGTQDNFADLVLISTRMRAGEFTEALAAVEVLDGKSKGQPLGPYLRGRIQAAQADVTAARQSFEQAVAADGGFFSAVSALAGLDLREDKFDAARARLEAFAQAHPQDVQAVLSLAVLLASDPARHEQAAKLVRDFIARRPSESAPRLWLVDHLLANASTAKQALTVAQGAQALLPEDPAVLDALGRSQLAAGDIHQAISSFTKAASLAPKSAEPMIRLADAYVARRDYPAAMQSLRRALDADPGSLMAYRGLANLARLTGKADEARNVARLMQREPRMAPMGYLFEGDLELAARRFDAAAVAYRKGLELRPMSELAMKLHTALSRGSQPGEAQKFAAAWIAKHPTDVQFSAFQADVAVANKDYRAAAQHFARALQLEPENARMLNDLAWVKLQLKEAGALDLAQRANAASPNSPGILDTLAQALAAENRMPEAIEVQRKALALRPDEVALQLTLAKLMVRGGDAKGARETLSKLAALPAGHPVATEASAVLANLDGKR